MFCVITTTMPDDKRKEAAGKKRAIAHQPKLVHKLTRTSGPAPSTLGPESINPPSSTSPTEELPELASGTTLTPGAGHRAPSNRRRSPAQRLVQKKITQKGVDGALLSNVKKTELLQRCLSTRFAFYNSARPYQLKF